MRLLCALLLATTRFWAGDERDPLAAHAAPRRRLPAATVAILLGACALAGALRWPLAHRGVWWDEAWSIRQVIVGTLKPDAADGKRLEFTPVPWSYTLWYYRKPTNHVLYSLAARTSLAAWRAGTGAAPEEWDEFALRFPAFAAAAAGGLPARPAGARPRLPARRSRGGRAAGDPPLAHPLRRRRPRLLVHGAVRDLRRLVPAPRAARRALALVARLRGVAARAALGPSPGHPLPHRPRRRRSPRHLASARACAPTAPCASGASPRPTPWRGSRTSS